MATKLSSSLVEYSVARRYTGNIKAVIFDWAGTVVDYGCFSPTNVFVELFASEGITISMADARGPMGVHKRVHIEKLLELDSVRQQWAAKHGDGTTPTQADVDRMYKNFTPAQKESVKLYAQVIPGVTGSCEWLRSNGIKIGSCTGFAKEILDILASEAANNGFNPDCRVAADEVPAARPLPHMVWLNAIRMNVHPIEAIVKVDDTVDGIREGIAAGCWTVGVAKTGNYMAATEADIQRMDPAEYARRLRAAHERLADSGASFVVDSVADLPEVIKVINDRMSLGMRP